MTHTYGLEGGFVQVGVRATVVGMSALADDQLGHGPSGTFDFARTEQTRFTRDVSVDPVTSDNGACSVNT